MNSLSMSAISSYIQIFHLKQRILVNYVQNHKLESMFLWRYIRIWLSIVVRPPGQTFTVTSLKTQICIKNLLYMKYWCSSISHTFIPQTFSVLSMSQPDVSQLVGEDIHSRVRQEKKEREHFLSLNQELARQVTLKSKKQAGQYMIYIYHYVSFDFSLLENR